MKLCGNGRNLISIWHKSDINVKVDFLILFSPYQFVLSFELHSLEVIMNKRPPSFITYSQCLHSCHVYPKEYIQIITRPGNYIKFVYLFILGFIKISRGRNLENIYKEVNNSKSNNVLIPYYVCYIQHKQHSDGHTKDRMNYEAIDMPHESYAVDLKTKKEIHVYSDYTKYHIYRMFEFSCDGKVVMVIL